MGADIACGEAQSPWCTIIVWWGIHGFLATTDKLFLRKMPGRICGVTKDRWQKRFCFNPYRQENNTLREKEKEFKYMFKPILNGPMGNGVFEHYG